MSCLIYKISRVLVLKRRHTAPLPARTAARAGRESALRERLGLLVACRRTINPSSLPHCNSRRSTVKLYSSGRDGPIWREHGGPPWQQRPDKMYTFVNHNRKGTGIPHTESVAIGPWIYSCVLEIPSYWYDASEKCLHDIVSTPSEERFVHAEEKFLLPTHYMHNDMWEY